MPTLAAPARCVVALCADRRCISEMKQCNGPRFPPAVLRAWPLLLRISPALRGVDFATPRACAVRCIAAAREEYEALRVEHDRIGAIHGVPDTMRAKEDKQRHDMGLAHRSNMY